jgi:hypothetical protein
MDAEFFILFNVFNFELKKTDKYEKVFDGHFKCLLLEHTFANNLHGMGQIIIKVAAMILEASPLLTRALHGALLMVMPSTTEGLVLALF